MRRYNYKSDFDFTMKLKDCNGDPTPFPDCDWSARFYTSLRTNAYVASRKGDQYINCFPTDDGGVHFVFDNHRLGAGTLKWEPHFELPNGIYPDNIQDLFGEQQLDVELVRGRGDCGTVAEIEAMLPFIKGDPFTYEDFTPEQIEDLKSPATEAAARLDSFVKEAKDAESGREANEKLRVSAENERAAQERSRMDAENTRNADETKRRDAESLRNTAEESRKKAESKRADTFDSWKTVIDGKAEQKELSNILGRETDLRLEEIEPNIVRDALRKTPQALSSAEKAQVQRNLGISKMELLCDLINKAVPGCGYAKMTDGEFDCEINGVKLTYDNAVTVYNAGKVPGRYGEEFYARNMALRTNLPSLGSWSWADMTRAFLTCYNLETVNMASARLGNATFYMCSKLRRIYGPCQTAVSGNADMGACFFQCYALEEIDDLMLTNPLNATVTPSLSFEWSPLLSLQTFQRIVSKAKTTRTFILTVHPDIYARMTDETDTEWHQVFLDAAEKFISIVTV